MKDKIIKTAKDLEQGIITENEARILLLGLFGVMPCFPSETEIYMAADEWEKNASCGAFEGGYINDDFIAGVNWLKTFLNKA